MRWLIISQAIKKKQKKSINAIKWRMDPILELEAILPRSLSIRFLFCPVTGIISIQIISSKSQISLQIISTNNHFSRKRLSTHLNCICTWHSWSFLYRVHDMGDFVFHNWRNVVVLHRNFIELLVLPTTEGRQPTPVQPKRGLRLWSHTERKYHSRHHRNDNVRLRVGYVYTSVHVFCSFLLLLLIVLVFGHCRSFAILECSRAAVIGATIDRSPNPIDRGDWEGALRRSVARQLARRIRCGEDIFQPRGMLMVPRSRDLPNGDAAAWEYPRIHCGW